MSRLICEYTKAMNGEPSQESVLDPEVILKAFAEGKENAAFHQSCADSLTSTATTTLTILSSGGFAALGYGAHLLESGVTPVSVAVIAASVHLLAVACLVNFKCLKADRFYPPANEAKNLLHAGYTWHEIVATEIDLLSDRTDRNQSRNRKVGRSLNRLRFASLLVPITFAVVWAVAKAVVEES